MAEQSKSPSRPADEWFLSIRKCSFRLGCLVPKGEMERLPIKEAVKRFAPSGTHKGKQNVVSAKAGNYLGVLNNGHNFLLINRAGNGDISWFLDKNPDFEKTAKEVYFVEEVTIPPRAKDLPPTVTGVI